MRPTWRGQGVGGATCAIGKTGASSGVRLRERLMPTTMKECCLQIPSPNSFENHNN